MSDPGRRWLVEAARSPGGIGGACLVLSALVLVFVSGEPIAEGFVSAGVPRDGGTRALLSVAAGLSLILVGGGAFLWADRRCRRRGEAECAARMAAVRAEAERAACVDPLTGLDNRRGLAFAFDERRRQLSERDLVITLLMVEVERLSQVARVEGRDAADALLTGFARLLCANLRREDRIGRLEDDRFLLILSAPRYSRPGEAVARRLQNGAAATPELRSLGAPVSLSFGIARITGAGIGFDQALGQADLALRAARDEGAGSVIAFRPRLGAEQEGRSRVLRTVAAALESGRIVPVYQPIVALGDRRIVGFEALARLRETDGTLIEAARLRPAFEDPHLSTRISERILAQAISDAGRLHRAGLAFGRLAVNVTEMQVADPDFAERVLDQLMMEGLSPHDLSLELTEHILLSRREPRILRTLESLADAGVALAFDDFGTGYAAISHLRRFPVDCLKLERSFISDIAADPAAREISAAVLGMARALDRRVVAEGVETAAVERVLRELGCDHVQGFYYSPPVPFGDVAHMARRGLAA